MCKLLIIDGNLIEHMIVGKLISRYGYDTSVEYSTNAYSVMESLKQNQKNSDELPDIIFLDMKFPVFTTWMFLKKFRELHIIFQKKIQIYIVTSSINHRSITRCKKFVFVHSYILKPLTKNILDSIFKEFDLARMIAPIN